MKTKLFIVYLLLINILLAQNFVRVIEPYVDSELNDIHLVNDQVGWIVGNKGIILYTSNGGYSWIKKFSQFQYNFLKVYFIDQYNGWIGTSNGRILRTTNGGESWTEHLISPDFTYFDAIRFTSVNNGHISIGKHRSVYLMKTSDGGLTWSKRDSLVSATVASRWYDIDFYDENLGVAVSDKKDGQRYTTNGGITWLKSTPITDAFFRDQRAVRWLNQNTVISMGEGNEYWGVVTPIYKSTDGGINWVKKTQFPQNNYDRIRDAHFKDSQNGIAVGSNGFSYAYISRTSDGGETWYASFLTYSFGLKGISGFNNKLIAIGTGAHILISNDFGLNWTLYKAFTPTPIYGIQFTGQKGYVVSRYSDFYSCDDINGENWTFLSSTGLWESVSMHFINENIGFVLKENRHIVKTTDSGESWRTVLAPVAFNARNKVGGIHFPSSNVGYAWMSLNDYPEYYVYKTTDSGENWFEISMLSGPGYISGGVGFFTEDIGVIVGPRRWLIRTTNGGTTWDTITNFIGFPSHLLTKDFEDLHIIDENNAWAVGIGFITRTTDRGLSWNYIDHGLTLADSNYYAVSFLNDLVGFVATYNGIVLKTTDGGNLWTQDTSLFGRYIIFSIAVNSIGRVFLGTSNGYLLASFHETYVYESQNRPINFSLEQNFPNPFNCKTKIRYSVSDEENIDDIQLKIYDLLGQEIITLINGKKLPGTYEIEFDAETLDLPSGVYFYLLSSRNKTAVKKMIYLK